MIPIMIIFLISSPKYDQVLSSELGVQNKFFSEIRNPKSKIHFKNLLFPLRQIVQCGPDALVVFIGL